MKTFILLFAATLCIAEKRDASFLQPYQGPLNQFGCISDQDAVSAFHTSFFTFTINLVKKAAERGNYFFTMSPHAVWVTLAAVAEGTDYFTQRDLFNLLGLPNDICSRQKFYQIATTRLSSTDAVSVDHTRALVIDENARLNPQWYNLNRDFSLLQVVPAPLRFDKATTTEIIKQTISVNAEGLDLTGNSVLLNSMDYNGLWTTAFVDSVINRSPFYSQAGQRIGSVDLMRVKRRARIGYVPSMNAKVVELPIGIRGEYSMIFALVVNTDASVEPAVKSLTNNTIFEIVASLQDTYSPIEIAIPRFAINSEINMKDVLEDMGVTKIWRDFSATRYLSTPSAKPSSYIHRATMTLNSEGVNPPPVQYALPYASQDEQYWREFIADRPFLMGLFDTETYTCLMGAMFSKPTYTY